MLVEFPNINWSFEAGRRRYLCRGLTELNLRMVNSSLPRGVKMAAGNHGSEMLKEEDLSSLTVQQLLERLNEKGLPTTGKKKVLLERLVNAQYVLQSNVDV